VIDFTRAGATKQLVLKLRPMGKGLMPLGATLDGTSVYPGGDGSFAGIPMWHAIADRAARSE